jgi:hypothetical protein
MLKRPSDLIEEVKMKIENPNKERKIESSIDPSNISFELREPLNSILNQSHILDLFIPQLK